MFSLNDSMRYLLYSEPTDMRKSSKEGPGEQEKVSKKDDVTNRVEELSGNENIVLEEYVYGDVTLVFAVDDALNNKELRLIYDSDPGWDNEQESTIDFVPERDKVKVYV